MTSTRLVLGGLALLLGPIHSFSFVHQIGHSLTPRNRRSGIQNKPVITLFARSIRQQQSNVEELKIQLMEASENRSLAESIIDQLAELNPTGSPATSPLLQQRWEVVWTTEKEINFFLDKGIADKIYQTIDGKKLENLIPFRKGGSFGVTGALIPSDGIRTEFTFESALLDLQWVRLPIPPIGAGWFDTVFLDKELRVDRNSRDDLLICRKS